MIFSSERKEEVERAEMEETEGEAWERAIHNKVKDLGKVYVSKGFSRQKLFCKYFFVVNVIYG